MKRILTITWLLFATLVVPVLGRAQYTPAPLQAIKRGTEIFAQTCTQSYCHGAYGAAGGAPRLAGRGFDAAFIERVITYGVPGTPMPAWGQKISEPDLKSVIAYVESLNGIAPSVRTGPPPPLTGDAARGRDLFFDPTEEARCSNCHRIDEKGIAVAQMIGSVPENSAGLRNVGTPLLKTATSHGETFPAVVNSQLSNEVTLFDLTGFPPVLRTFMPSDVTIKEGSAWKHSTVLGKYADADLDLILSYLRAVKNQ